MLRARRHAKLGSTREPFEPGKRLWPVYVYHHALRPVCDAALRAAAATAAWPAGG
eukprot:gene16868-67025_t